MQFPTYWFPTYWNEERRGLAVAILRRNGAASYECLFRDACVSQSNAGDFKKEKELKEILNFLLKKGKLKAYVELTKHAQAYTLFYNPRRFQP